MSKYANYADSNQTRSSAKQKIPSNSTRNEHTDELTNIRRFLKAGYESAIKRRAPILGEIIGYGFSSNAEHISTPNVDGPSRAMKKAIEQANINTSDISYVNAHATSTPVGDYNEAKAIFEVFGYNGPYVSSTKSMTGHECWMAGASEVIYSMIMILNDFIAPNINLKNTDEDSSKLNLVKKTLDKKFNVFLSNSFGFGGTNSALIIKKITS